VDDRVAIVTGSGTGIGAEAARLLAAQGMTVALVGRRREPLEQVAASLEGGRGLVVPADLREGEAPAAIVREVLAQTDGRLDVIVNNAANFVLRPFGEFTLDDVDAVLAVNVRAPFLLVQEALPALERSPAGCVVNVSSAAARMFRPGQAVYAFSKAALEHMTKQLAAELAPRRIRVNGVMPGPTDTPIHSVAVADPEARKAALGRMVPLGRVGEAEEVALWIAHLVDRRAAWVTGTIVEVDGGRVLGPPESV
jgi:NAD(P)-dependent dehydrogenase (short-subunit alcohol dehydrogenase family)